MDTSGVLHGHGGARALVILLLAAVLALGVAAPASAAPVYDLYFGDLHAHTGYSDGASGTTPWDAFPVGKASGADFMALTEHHSTSNAYEPWTMDEQEWQDLKAVAEHFTSSSFVAIPAYEYWLVANNGELNVFNVPDLPPKQEFLGPDRLPMFYDWLSGWPGAVAQFNHPTYVTHDFKDYFGYSVSRDASMGLIEVFNDVVTQENYVKALDAGWHLMPSANSDTHDTNWIWGSDVRTVLLAERLTPAGLYAALRAQRGYATLDKNLHITFSMNGAVMGSTVRPASSYTADVKIWDPDALAGSTNDAVTQVEIVADGGEVVHTLKPTGAAGTQTITWRVKALSTTARYFWVRVSTASEDFNHAPGVTAWTAPVWTGR
ncbi:MAG TPA: CehA/McbA family metallohydrolase [Thermoleophilia bacterium]|nr:CehA/McbA family metallohydrolase [Thermoleophilia bacterium]